MQLAITLNRNKYPQHINCNNNSEKISSENKTDTSQKFKETWDLAKILELVNYELEIREACTPKAVENYKNDLDSYERLSHTGSSLLTDSQHGIQDQSKFPDIKSLPWGHGHWSAKCLLITILRQGKTF